MTVNLQIKSIATVTTAALVTVAALAGSAAQAQQYAPQDQPQYQMQEQAPDQDAQLNPRFQRQIVSYQTREAPGTVIIDTPNTYLYYVLGNGQAVRYGIGVGRDGFTWAGVKQIAKKSEWPDWYPPAEMIARQPYLPRMTMGGPGNPLGARALYLGTSQYRIHGTNDPTTIGKTVSSGCIRLTNENVIDLYNRVQVGAKVIVLPQTTEARAHRPQREASQPRQTAQPVSMTSSYAVPSGARRTWANIRPADLY